MRPIRLVRFLVLLLPVVLTGCFEYEEKIVFAADYSGTVEIRYDVPVYETEERSLISSFPVSLPLITKKYNRSGHHFSIEGYNYERHPTDEKMVHFKNRATVSFRIPFHSPAELEAILIGKTTVQLQEPYLTIRRSFPLNRPFSDESGRFLLNFQNKYLETFRNRNIRITMQFPWYYDLVTNQGSFRGPGSHFFSIPLDRLHNRKKLDWTINFKANRFPKEGS